MNELHAQIISRQQAKQLGMLFYFTGNPCPNSHVRYRFSSSARCTCRYCSEQQAERQKAWKLKNKCGVSRYNQEYRLKNLSDIKKRRLDHYNKNRENYLEYAKGYRESNPNKVAMANKNWQERNKEYLRSSRSIYREKNKEKRSATQSMRYAAKNKRTLKHNEELTLFVLQEAYQQSYDLEDLFGFRFHVDHAIPMQSQSVSGLHVWYNLQVIPAYLNISKGNRLMLLEPLDWIGACI